MAIDASHLERESIAGNDSTDLAQLILDLASVGVAAGGGVTAISAVTGDDISAKIITAQATLGAAGGRIILPAGVFFVQGVPLIDGVYYEGAGETVTQLKLPNGASSAMFIASADLLIGWGFRGIYFSGIYNSTFFGANNSGGALLPRSTQNCIDTSAATNVVCGNIEDCWFEYFNRAYNGSAASGTNFDLYVSAINCRFQYNNIALLFSEHYQPLDCFFSYNGTTDGAALTGGGAVSGRINDCIFRACWFASNYVDVFAAAGKTVQNTQFIGCGFFSAMSVNLVLDMYCIVSGCTLWGNAAVTSYGMKLRGGYHAITGNKFNETGGSFVGGCIQLNDSGANLQISNLTITGNTIQLLDATCGPFLDSSGLTNNSSQWFCSNITGNTVFANRKKLINQSGNALVFGLAISGNSFQLQGDYTSGTPIAFMDFKTGAAALGNIVTGNIVELISGKGNLIGGQVYGSIITSNFFDPFVLGATFNLFLAGATTTGVTIQNNRNYVTRNSGTAALAAAISIVVTHGLASTPNIADIILTPQGACLTPPYVSTVTSTQFTINIAAATTANIGWVATCNP